MQLDAAPWDGDLHTMIVYASKTGVGFRHLERLRGTALRLLFVTVVFLLGAASAFAAPEAELWPRWEEYDPASTVRVDHAAWGDFLDAYLVTNHPSGVNRVDYGSVSRSDHAALDGYVADLQEVAVSELNRDEQLAYWINLYNAATVKLILDNYPVDSIREIKPGVFASGPWDMELLEIGGEAVTLNDVEHRIIRPIWQDPRIHYVVNCASYGCPNLYPEPLSAANWDRVFDESARAYINHPRGVRLERNRLILSSIYDWYVADFGGDVEGVIAHVSTYVDGDTADQLHAHDGRVAYEYDWTLNEP